LHCVGGKTPSIYPKTSSNLHLTEKFPLILLAQQLLLRFVTVNRITILYKIAFCIPNKRNSPITMASFTFLYTDNNANMTFTSACILRKAPQTVILYIRFF